MMVEFQNVDQHISRIVSAAGQAVCPSDILRSSLLVVMMTLFIAPASGQSMPAPPTLCINDSGDCGSVVIGAPGSKKWNPGHYIKPQGNHAQSDKQKYYTSVTNQMAKIADSPEIQGAMIAYSWGMVEPSLGNYDWSPIYTHLDYLSSRGLKMILSINTKCFGNNCASLAPADLQTEVYVTPKDPPTLTMELWEERNMDLYIALWQALAEEFDGNPALEMVLGAESTPSLQGSSPENYTRGIYAEQLKRLYSAQAAAFTNTNVIANINFLSHEVTGLIEHAYQVGVGRGMPDIFDSAGSLVFRGDCSAEDCGTRDYRGLVPHLGVSSFQQLTGKFSTNTDSPAEAIVYGLENKITHFAWVSNESGEDSWPNIISAIEAANPDAHTACPLAYTAGCQ